jgi:hypothetical protein
VPAYHARRRALAERIRVSVSLASADPEMLAAAARQLGQLRASPIGQWLRPGGAASRPHIDIGNVIRERAVALFSLGAGGHASAAARIAWLIGQDILAADADLCEIGISGDGIAWFDHCEGLPQPMLKELIGRGADAGLPVLLATTSARAGLGLASEVNALVIHHMPDAGSAERFAGLTGEKLVPEPYGQAALAAPPGSGPAAASRATAAAAAVTDAPAAGQDGPPLTRKPVVPPAALQQFGRGEFALVVKQPMRRLAPRARTVPARVPGSSRQARTEAAVAPAVRAATEEAT